MCQEVFLRLSDSADVLIEPYRPGVMESLGLGPEVLRARNDRLVYTRLTGWGQDGPLASTAGHDINYIGLSGALSLIVRGAAVASSASAEEASIDRTTGARILEDAGRPLPPLNLLGDFAGGSLTCALGITLALLERERSGRGQCIDAAMIDGTAYLSSFVWRLLGTEAWGGTPGSNMLDGGAPYYDVYRTADRAYMAIGAIEPQFWALVLEGLAPYCGGQPLPDQNDRKRWPELRSRLAAIFASRTQSDWVEVFEGSDACVTPVLNPADAAVHPHNVARGLFYRESESSEAPATGRTTPSPAPRLSDTPANNERAAGVDNDQVDSSTVNWL